MPFHQIKLFNSLKKPPHWFEKKDDQELLLLCPLQNLFFLVPFLNALSLNLTFFFAYDFYEFTSESNEAFGSPLRFLLLRIDRGLSTLLCNDPESTEELFSLSAMIFLPLKGVYKGEVGALAATA